MACHNVLKRHIVVVLFTLLTITQQGQQGAGHAQHDIVHVLLVQWGGGQCCRRRRKLWCWGGLAAWEVQEGGKGWGEEQGARQGGGRRWQGQKRVSSMTWNSSWDCTSYVDQILWYFLFFNFLIDVSANHQFYLWQTWQYCHSIYHLMDSFYFSSLKKMKLVDSRH